MKDIVSSSKYILLYLFTTLLIGCNSTNKKANYDYYQDSGEIFHTYFHIKYEYNRSVKEEIMDALQTFDQSLNPFKENSIIGKVNNNVPVTLDSLFIKVFEKSMEVSRKTNGKFDITASPFINAWGFGFKDMDNVTQEKIDSMKPFVGYEKIRIENGVIVKDDPRVQINTSAIAKGYYICYLNAGDAFYDKKTVEEIVAKAQQFHFPDILYGETVVVDNKGKFLHNRRLKAPESLNWKSFKQGMLVCHQAFIIERSIFEPYDLTYQFSSDVDWCIRLMKKSKSIVNTHLVMIKYLNEGVTTRNHNASLKERYQIMTKHYGAISTLLHHAWFVMRAILKPEKKN